MTTGSSYQLRLGGVDQHPEIHRVKRLRAMAAALRSRASQGYYGDNELKEFWEISETAGLILMASNTELAERAGVGDGFFLSVARHRRRPKLTNFLKALTAVIEIAGERLTELGASTRAQSRSEHTIEKGRLEGDCSQLCALANSLAFMAKAEIEKLDAERPNYPETIESHRKQRELLVIFADGFEQIAAALRALSNSPGEAALLVKAGKAVKRVGTQVSSWWHKNGMEIVDCAARLPLFAAGVAMLGWAGANMTVATTAVAALVGGAKVASALRKNKQSKHDP